ncbi:ComF family protein [Marinicrinis sediminis]|uniref:ComF family protein n=1 Tax=Marinicrinis sediminis TaxID=1652465 RepID=A0ABW5RB58_9BACL
MKKLMEALMSQKLPECLACGRAKKQSRGLCTTCIAEIPWVQAIQCKRCGRDIECPDCRRLVGPYALTAQRSAVRYAEPFQHWLEQYKFSGNEQWRPCFAYLMERAYERLIADFPALLQHPRFLIPIPLSRERLEQRGFNQAEHLAKALALHEGLPMFSLLERPVHLEKQSSRTRQERLQALSGVFAICPQENRRCIVWWKRNRRQKPPVAILIDDIYTTGSTLHEAAVTLRKKIPIPVFALTLARS